MDVGGGTVSAGVYRRPTSHCDTAALARGVWTCVRAAAHGATTRHHAHNFRTGVSELAAIPIHVLLCAGAAHAHAIAGGVAAHTLLDCAVPLLASCDSGGESL